jgi:signal transduction histidine kinase
MPSASACVPVSGLPQGVDNPAAREVALWRRRAFEAVQAQGRERERIAAGLHDDIGQTLAVAALKLGQLRTHVPPGDGASLLDELRVLLGQAAQATRSATFELSCPLLQQLGLRAALASLAQRAEARAGLRVHLRVPEPLPPLAEPVLGVLYRVARELLFNVCKHARARHAELRLRTGRMGCWLAVADDGVGFCVAERAGRFGPEGGYGLVSAVAQVQAVGGRLALRSRPGQGTVARLWVPAGPEARLTEPTGPDTSWAAPWTTPLSASLTASRRHAQRPSGVSR